MIAKSSRVADLDTEVRAGAVADGPVSVASVSGRSGRSRHAESRGSQGGEGPAVDYPVVGLEAASTLAMRAGISTPTVL